MRLRIKNKNTIYLLPFERIMFCKAEGNYTSFVLKDRKVISYQSLKETIKYLPEGVFFRCHNSYIVNLNEITEFNLRKNTLTLRTNVTVPVSLRRKKGLQCVIKIFINRNRNS